MKIVSYAQNFEDLMLWRALKNIQNGLYIDVGACDPVIDSITKNFYDNGWSGINIEPDPKYFMLLEEQRERDVNLNCVVGDSEGLIKFYVSSIRGWSSVHEETVAHSKEAGGSVTAEKIEIIRLSNIIDQYIGKREIHFLKIDVEGSEESVLNSIDFNRHRPWILVVESVNLLGDSQESVDFQSMLENYDYFLCYNDGLNLFFLAEEHKNSLQNAFKIPINIFDNYTTLREINLEKDSEDAQQLIVEKDAQLQSAQQLIVEKDAQLQSAQQLIVEKDAQLQSAKYMMQVTLKKLVRKPLKLIYVVGVKSRFFRSLIQGIEPVLPRTYRRLANAGKFEHEHSKIPDLPLFKSDHANQTPPLFGHINQSIIFLYVDHTCRFSLNTGIQQLVRQCLVAFLKAGCHVIPVKWNKQSSKFQSISVNECKTLLLYCESLDVLYHSILLSVATDKVIDTTPSNTFSNILFVPEVTYINDANKDVTLEVIKEAARLSIKTSFVFYDDTPIHRTEMKLTRDHHINYMKEIIKADFIFSISDYSKKNLFNFWEETGLQFPSNSVIETIHLSCGFTPSDFVADGQVEDNQITEIGCPFILSVGSITEHKNQLTLLKAFRSFKDKYPKSQMKLVLIGNMDHEISPCIQKLTSTFNDVFIIEGAPNKTVIAAYQSCDFTVFPSVIEGFGLPIVESLFFNKPCITANFGAMGEVGKGGGCLLVDTHSTEALAEAVELLALNIPFFEQIKVEAKARKVDDWSVYVSEVARYWCGHDDLVSLPNLHRTKKRIFWLGMHKILVKTELQRLRELGFEVFNPPYLSSVSDQSAQYNWDVKQESSLPPYVFERLSKTNFFYVDSFNQEITTILNNYFDCVIVTISPTWLAPILRHFEGTIIYRVYGQSHSLTNELIWLGVDTIIKDNPKFHFVPHSAEAVDKEESWLRENERAIPYCLPDDVFSYADSWVGLDASNGEIAMSCPNISNAFYAEHYKLLKNHFNDPCYKFYGVQLSEHSDPAVVGTLPRFKLIDALRNSACYVYTYDDPRVCYLPPIESMVIGLPVLFPRGCLLDKYFSGEETPARFDSFDHCKELLQEILAGNKDLIDEILMKQKQIIKRYKPSDVWPVFDNYFLEILE